MSTRRHPPEANHAVPVMLIAHHPATGATCGELTSLLGWRETRFFLFGVTSCRTAISQHSESNAMPPYEYRHVEVVSHDEFLSPARRLHATINYEVVSHEVLSAVRRLHVTVSCEVASRHSGDVGKTIDHLQLLLATPRRPWFAVTLVSCDACAWRMFTGNGTAHQTRGYFLSPRTSTAQFYQKQKIS